jgi:hypothetical protein
MAATPDHILYLFQATQNLQSQSADTLITALQQLEPILAQEAFRGGYGSAHEYTASQIRQHLPTLYHVDTQFELSNPRLSLDVIESDMLLLEKELEQDANSASKLEQIRISFAKIRSANPPIDPESQANVAELISRTWSLASKLGDTYRGLVASCFCDNIGDGGGCLAGLVARLYSPYGYFLKELLDFSLTQHRPSTARPSSPRTLSPRSSPAPT